MNNRLLVIEDEENIAYSIKQGLEAEGFEILLAQSMQEARQFFKESFELIILDWMLPDGSGVDLLREFKENKIHAPVIILTAKSDLIDKVVGFELGADDYMTKPFAFKELVARIRARLRDKTADKQSEQKEFLSFRNVKLYDASKKILLDEEFIPTTKTEFNLLKLFIENPDKLFTREELLKKVWGYNNYPTTRTVDNHVKQIRHKLGSDIIKTVHGMGYRLNGQ